MKKLFAIAVLVLVLILVLQLVSFACPPPPPEPTYCSPGFWKNHTEDWAYLFPDTWEDIVADLKARGYGSAAIRYAAAGMLNDLGLDVDCD